MAVYLDYISFTYNVASGQNGFDRFREEFPEFEEMYQDSYFWEKKGFTYANYQKVLVLNDYMRIHYDDDENLHRGVNVSVSSKGLPLLIELLNPAEKYKGQFDDDLTAQLLQLIDDRHCVLKRADIYVDDFTKTFYPAHYGSWMLNNQLRTKFRRYEILSDGQKGVTFYLGDRSNGKFLRIYDKEKESEGRINAIRYEIELRKGYALTFSRDYRNNPGIDFVQFLRGSFFEVIDNSTCKSNKSMCPLLPEWETFIISSLTNSAESPKIQISLERKHDPGKSWMWFYQYCMPMFYYSRKALGPLLFDEFVTQRMHTRSITAKDRHIMAMLSKYKDNLKAGSQKFLDNGEEVDWLF